jgi:hypothetical protein
MFGFNTFFNFSDRLFRKIFCSFLCLAGFTFAHAQVPRPGCTDTAATNYNATATINDGSCLYKRLAINPKTTYKQPEILVENSGAVYWNGLLWQHNDGGHDPVLYAMDTLISEIKHKISITGVYNLDWEDIAQDEAFFYIGDFGNNQHGSRTDLTIYRIAKSAIANISGDTSVSAELITFRYEDQPFPPQPTAGNKTDFDCEAMIAWQGKLFLFTKQWVSRQTTIYELPATPGSHIALRKATFNSEGMITGADIQPDGRRIALCGYSMMGNRFLILLYDYPENRFFEGNKRRINLTGVFQTESVAFGPHGQLYMGSESFGISHARLEAIWLNEIPGRNE